MSALQPSEPRYLYDKPALSLDPKELWILVHSRISIRHSALQAGQSHGIGRIWIDRSDEGDSAASVSQSTRTQMEFPFSANCCSKESKASRFVSNLEEEIADHGVLKCHEAVTYRTHSDYTFVDNLVPLLES
uniref:Uncharacterized protein n=1 Tax=Glossina austeni TaxID=7395 RepID=A0A1A9VH53_GLOAU